MPDREFDLCGLKCPLPVLRTKRILSAAAPGELVLVLTDDPRAPEDIRTFTVQSGHALISQEPAVPGGPVTVHRIRRKG